MSIQARQNDSKAISLLRAIRVANRVPTLLDAVRSVVAVLFVMGAVALAALAISSPVYAAVATGWAAISALLLAPYAKKRSIEAASVQELFDRYVFGLGESSRARRIEPERLHELSTKYSGNNDELRDWYPTSKPTFPFDVPICQRSNLFYDINLRRRWGLVLAVAACVWTVLGFMVGSFAGISVGQFLLRWLAPSLPAFVFVVDAARSQAEVVAERQSLLARVNDALMDSSRPISRERTEMLQTIVSEVQDGIFDTRCQTSRVPNWFYKVSRTRDNAAMHAAAGQLAPLEDRSPDA